MTNSPSVPHTLIDNLLTRKKIRDKTMRRLRSRERVEVKNFRTNLYNTLIEANGNSPVSTWMIEQELSEEDFPEHLALIPDGNRRWARARDMSVGKGYLMGSEKLKKFRNWAMVENDIKYATCFTLSTENIERRPEDELAQLFGVFNKFFRDVAESEEVHKNEIKHEVRGNREKMKKLPDEVREAISIMEESTSDYSKHKIVFLLPYGSRDSIINAVQNVNEKNDTPVDVETTDSGEDSDIFREELTLGDLPDPELMIRTSETRISNFMLYQLAYSELVFLEKNWPSFTRSDFYESIYSYANRDRRFGV